MNRPYDEQISALADGELTDAELALLLRREQRDGTLGDRLSRYVLIRDALHRNLPDAVDPDLADRVADQLAMEPAHNGARRSGRFAGHRRWTQSVAGAAIAASVAMVAVVIWPTQQDTGSPGQQAIPQSAGMESRSEGNGVRTVASENIRWDRLDPDVQARLNGYAITHGEQSVGRQVGVGPRQVRITTGQGADQ